MEFTLTNVPYIAQQDDQTCWNAAYKMMLRYKDKSGNSDGAADSLPNVAQMRERGILDAEFPYCRNKLGLCSSTYKGFLETEDIIWKLKAYGPIWVSGDYCEKMFKHIIVVTGANDDEVICNDPYSGFRYGLVTPRKIPMRQFVSKINRVEFSCQHWF